LKHDSGDCRSQKGFSGEPDTLPWTRIHEEEEQTNQEENPQQITQKISVDSLSLEPGLVYYAILHVFPLAQTENLHILSESNNTEEDNNEGVFINTNGTLILPLVREDWIEEIDTEEKQIPQDLQNDDQETEMNRVEKRKIRRERQVQLEVRKQGRRKRSLDEEREREEEEEAYFRGDGVYSFGRKRASFINGTVVSNSTDYGNNDDLTDGGIVGIVIAGIALLLICLIILLAIHFFSTGLNKKRQI